MNDEQWLEELWADLLSEDTDRILAAWVVLSEEERVAVWKHLHTMSTEEGWADVQRESAQAAIDAIQAADQ